MTKYTIIAGMHMQYQLRHMIKRLYRARKFGVTSILLIYFQQHNRRYVSVMNECD